MYISFDSDEILSEDIDFSGCYTFSDTVSFTVSGDILEIFLLIDTCDITWVEYIIDIF